jgi:hypothetical protein
MAASGLAAEILQLMERREGLERGVAIPEFIES